MNLKRCLCFLCWGVFVVTGCASAGDSSGPSLARQQSATIESLKSEIHRLNQELDGRAGLRVNLQKVQPKVEEMFAEHIARGDVRVVLDSRGLVVTVLDHAIFDPDETQMTSSGEATLEKIAEVLSRDLPANRVTVEGHTDDQAVEGASGVTNWEYSIGRATAVLHYFLEAQELAPERFAVAGYAEYRPLDSNATETGRDRNRRVEIVIEPQRSFDASSR